MHLENLPAAILRILFNGQNSWCIIELWKCGNRTLNTRLANKGVTSVILRTTRHEKTSRWPRCLSFFKLEHLSVHRLNGQFGTPAMLRSELKQLSSTLISLQITGLGVFEAIFLQRNSHNNLPASEDATATEPFQKRSKSTVSDDSNQPHAMMWHLDTTWPRLERFTLRDDLSLGLDPYIFALLPRSLILFHCTVRAPFVLENLSGLPSTLQDLVLPPASIGSTGLRTLPKSITTLGRSLRIAAQLDLANSPSILPLLRQMTWSEKFSKLVSSEATEPNFLESLTALTIPWSVKLCPAMSQLPSKLTTLNIFPDGFTFFHQDIATLPRTLETLFVDCINCEDLQMNDFPPHLRELEFNNIVEIVYHHFSLLPRTLTTIIGLAHLPAAEDFEDELQELKDIGRQSLALDQERWSTAKSKLFKSGARREAYIARVEDGQLFGLPLGLTESCLEDKASRFLLPPLIASHLINEVALLDRSALSCAPPTKAFHAIIEDLGATHPELYDHYQVFPPETSLYRSEIASLQINIVSTNVQDQQVLFRCLPPTLTLLVLNSYLSISANELQFLPTTLVSLKFQACALEDCADNWLGMLPRKLTTLHLPREALIRGDWLLHLPQTLIEL